MSDPVVAFRNPNRIPFALAMFDCWMDNADGDLRTETVLADVFGHASYQDLVHVSQSWSPEISQYGDVRDLLAGKLSFVSGRGKRECAEFLDLLNVNGDAIDRPSVLEGLSRHLEGHPFGASICSFFDSHGFLLNDVDLALRLRAAGKHETDYEEAQDRRILDILDCLRIATEGKKPPARFNPTKTLVLYYGASSRSTVMSTSIFRLTDELEGLTESDEAVDDLVKLMNAAKGYENPRLDHAAFGDIIREPVFPIPGDHRELDAAVNVHWALRDIADEFFGIFHPNYVLPDNGPCRSWVQMEKELQRPEASMSFLEQARDRIIEFVEGYTDYEGAWVSFQPWDVLALVRECQIVSRCDDAALARYLAADNGKTWKSDEMTYEDQLKAALEGFAEGRPKKEPPPSQGEDDESWKQNPELHKVEQALFDIARGRNSKD